MIVRLHLKDPDGVYDSVERSLRDSVGEFSLSRRERDALVEARREDLDLSRWVKYGEYVTIEIDTSAGTARVVPVSDS